MYCETIEYMTVLLLSPDRCSLLVTKKSDKVLCCSCSIIHILHNYNNCLFRKTRIADFKKTVKGNSRDDFITYGGMTHFLQWRAMDPKAQYTTPHYTLHFICWNPVLQSLFCADNNNRQVYFPVQSYQWTLKYWGGDSHDLFQGTIPLIHLEWLRKTRKSSVSIVYAPVKNQTRHLPNISQKQYHLSQLTWFDIRCFMFSYSSW